MPNQTEPNANNALGDLLRAMMSGSRVLSENTQTFPAHPGRHADVLITAPGRSPVVVEAEYEPALEAEQDAAQRLGLQVTGESRTIESAIALRYPEFVHNSYNVSQAVADVRLSYCVLYEDGSRFPASGWLEGSVTDLADLVRLVSVPQKEVDSAADKLQDAIRQAATMLDEEARLRPAVGRRVAGTLGMDDVPQTRRMASAIIANAMVFHIRIAGMHDGIKQLHQVCESGADNPQREIIAAWENILRINYWPIFDVARRIVGELSPNMAGRLIRTLELPVSDITATGVDNSHDLTGRVFQRLISDRKYLATFYTRPESAALLARLAVAKLEGVDWADTEAIGSLRIGDFACGTGALLSAVYEQVATRHQRAGGDLASLHPVMMEEVLYGCDVMPSAVHITCATLSGAQPSVGFKQSRIYTMPYGRQSGGTVSIGSLELLQSSHLIAMLNTNDPARRTGRTGEEIATQINVDIPDGTFDIVIMNPPFTSDTKHFDSDEGVLNAAFAAYNSSEEDQDAMANRLRLIGKDSTYHGHAGLGSAFASVAHQKLRKGGVIALVLPFSAVAGSSWAKFRHLISENYTDLTIVTIAAAGNDQLSFSSDTKIAECLVIARKERSSVPEMQRARFTSLNHRPQGFAHASTIANDVANLDTIRTLEDGPYGGTGIPVGDEFAGETLDAPTGDFGSRWGAARIADASVAQTAHSLTWAKLWLPGQAVAVDLPTTQLNQVGRRGHDSQMFISAAHNGPFSKVAYSPTATYPCLWSHSAKKETRILCEPDSQLQVKQGMESRAAEIWTTASFSHISRGFRFNSQPLAIAVTKEKTIGGRAWPNVVFDDSHFDHALAVWGNSTLGFLCYWWHSSCQVAGRGDMTINAAESLPTLDFRALSADQLATAEDIFNDFRKRELKPAYVADADPNRALLDRRVICELLGFDESVYEGVRRLAAKWCAEPSVHGGKARPKDATLVM